MKNWAHVLVVLDGASPHIKKECCNSRKDAREAAVAARDSICDLKESDNINDSDRLYIGKMNKEGNIAKIKAANKAVSFPFDANINVSYFTHTMFYSCFLIFVFLVLIFFLILF